MTPAGAVVRAAGPVMTGLAAGGAPAPIMGGRFTNPWGAPASGLARGGAARS
jgi:hypothetical protein